MRTLTQKECEVLVWGPEKESVALGFIGVNPVLELVEPDPERVVLWVLGDEPQGTYIRRFGEGSTADERLS